MDVDGRIDIVGRIFSIIKILIFFRCMYVFYIFWIKLYIYIYEIIWD